MFWHSTVMSLDNVQTSHVWLLTSMIEMPNGEFKPYNKTQLLEEHQQRKKLAQQIEELRSNGIDEVWVSYKLPLLVFLFPVILPMALLGDITAIILSIAGL